jgi:protein-tyrosine-phosphatase
MNVLFLCTANSCRSILAEAIFNHLAPPGWQSASAGSQPAGYVNPRALALWVEFNPDCPLANFGDFEASYGGLVGMVRWVGF